MKVLRPVAQERPLEWPGAHTWTQVRLSERDSPPRHKQDTLTSLAA